MNSISEEVGKGVGKVGKEVGKGVKFEFIYVFFQS
jgi:hypothetical protein